MDGFLLPFISRTLVIGGIVYGLDIDGINRWGPAFKVGAAGAVGSVISDKWIEPMIGGLVKKP